MSDFLAQMTDGSRRRAKAAAEREPLAALRARAADLPDPPPLALEHGFELIAEYKRNSPSLGRLAGGDDRLPARVTAYARGGAAAVSVLTEPERFDGSFADLGEAAVTLEPLGIPVLRKDFLVDPYQVYESRAAGAGGLLLIARLLTATQFSEMLDCAHELSLFVLAEAFDAGDIERISTACLGTHANRGGAPVLIGVNSRDLATLEVIPYKFRELAPLLPPGMPRVAESGISTPAQCADIAGAGFSAALVGGSLMREPNPVTAIRAMLAAGRSAARSAA